MFSLSFKSELRNSRINAPCIDFLLFLSVFRIVHGRERHHLALAVLLRAAKQLFMNKSNTTCLYIFCVCNVAAVWGSWSLFCPWFCLLRASDLFTSRRVWPQANFSVSPSYWFCCTWSHDVHRFPCSSMANDEIDLWIFVVFHNANA